VLRVCDDTQQELSGGRNCPQFGYQCNVIRFRLELFI
jgi:hypothetical protein